MIDERSQELLKKRLLPIPREIEFFDEEMYHIKNGCQVELIAPAGAETLVSNTFRNYWKMEPQISCQAGGESISAEGYDLSVNEQHIRIEASDLSGVRNALKTLRQLAEAERGVLYFSEYIVVPCKIKDEPAIPFRGVHLCWFPETPAFEIEKQIRLAAYFKFNAIVLEPWGVFPYDSHPEFGWAECAVPRAEFKRLIALGKELGLTMIPQINLFGHASWSRIASGKHAILDFHPELESLFEPDGWSWCLTNPETINVLKDLVCEIHEFFGNPPYFHIGFDEAHDAFSCVNCRKVNVEDTIAAHINKFHDLLASRGARALMWHDMLLTEGDPKWSGYYAFGNPASPGLIDKISKDMILCDWEYGYPVKEGQEEPDWRTSIYFKEKGFDVFVCPWHNSKGTISFGKAAGREKLAGYLMTTWHMNHSSNMAIEFAGGGMAAWLGEQCPTIAWRPAIQCAMMPVFRHIARDMNITEYEQTGTTRNQISPYNTPEVQA